MPDEVNPLVTVKEYVLSNGTKVISDAPVNFYTDSEILKIEIAGAILVIAILLITYAMYKWYMGRYTRWLRSKEIEDKMALGVATQDDLDELDKPVPGVNKGMMFAFGILIMAAGAVMYLMP